MASHPTQAQSQPDPIPDPIQQNRRAVRAALVATCAKHGQSACALLQFGQECSIPTTHNELPTTNHPLPSTHCSLLTAHYHDSLLITHDSLLTTHYSLLITYNSLLTTHYSLLTTHYSLLATHYLLLTTYSSLLTTHYSQADGWALSPRDTLAEIDSVADTFQVGRLSSHTVPPIPNTFQAGKALLPNGPTHPSSCRDRLLVMSIGSL